MNEEHLSIELNIDFVNFLLEKYNFTSAEQITHDIVIDELRKRTVLIKNEK